MATDPLAGMLQRCSLHVLLMVTATTLSRSGFGDVEIQGRRKSRQKSRNGGHELLCRTTIGGQPVRVLVKVIQDKIRTRMVHEMAGCLIDFNGDIGLVISPFNSSALGAKKQVINPKLGVRVIEGSELVKLMRCSGIGVRPKGDVDYAFFGELEARSAEFLAYLKAIKR